jgi:hypothetical protein
MHSTWAMVLAYERLASVMRRVVIDQRDRVAIRTLGERYARLCHLRAVAGDAGERAPSVNAPRPVTHGGRNSPPRRITYATRPSGNVLADSSR